ncbi:MAG: HAMP domain-containing protein [Planctomycetales bacterium]|nr:HAMP domain-containing protein [Planctomycetales bacterium]
MSSKRGGFFQRHLGARIVSGYALVVLLFIVGAGSGFWGINRLGSILDYVLGPAWETADGSMMASIEVESQMLAVDKIVNSIDVEAAESVLEGAREEARMHFQRMDDADVLDQVRVDRLWEERDVYEQQLDHLLTAHQQFLEDRARLEESTVEMMSWDNALIGQAEAVDEAERAEAEAFAYRANVHQLRQAYLLEQLFGGCDPRTCLEAVDSTASERREFVATLGQAAWLDTDSFDVEAYREATQRYDSVAANAATSYLARSEAKTAYEANASEFLATIEELEEIADGSVETVVSQAATSKVTAIAVLATSFALSLALAMVAGWLTTRAVTRPISRMVEFASAVAGGELSRRLPEDRHDELGKLSQSLNLAVASSEDMLNQVRESSEREARLQSEESNRRRLEAEVLEAKVDEMLAAIHRVSQGDYSRRIDLADDDAVSELGRQLQSFFDEKSQSEERERQHVEAERIRQTEEARQQAEVAASKSREAQELQSRVDEMLRVLTQASQGDYSQRLQGDSTPIGRLASGVGSFVDAKRDAEEAARQRQEEDRRRNEQDQLRADEERERIQLMRSKVNELLTHVAAAAEGDLTASIKMVGNEPIDDLGNGIGRMLGDLRDVISNILGAAEQFVCGSQMIAESARAAAEGAQEQSASVDRINSSVEQLATSIDNVKRNADAADQVARETVALATNSDAAIRNSAEAMRQIKESSTQISEISAVISEIASQTNLLALNAAIEAARAGEHGAGFAVVADEVRNLAERANQAAGEITSLIKESAARVDEGASINDATVSALEQIVKGMQTTASRVSDITKAMGEQSRASIEVSQAIEHIAQVAEDTAARSEEMAASSQQLGSQAESLHQMVAHFKVSGLPTTAGAFA